MSQINRLKLRQAGLEVSRIGLGTWAIGGPFWSGETALGWGEVDDNESINAIHAGLDMGVNFIDTADVYGAGHSEQVVAKALHGRRDQVVISTKFGNDFNPETKQVVGSGADAKFIRQACENSLKRLNTNYIDIYHFHTNEYPVEQAGDVRNTLENLAQEGKIRAYGWSTDSLESAKFFAEGKHCVSVQHQLNLFEDNADMLAFCATENLASINRGPLAMGLLTGKFTPQSKLAADDIRGQNMAWMAYFIEGRPNQEWLEKLSAMQDILQSNGRSLVQGALAWLWARSPQTVPIPGFRTVKQVTENCAALEFGPLTPEQMAEIETILGRG